MKVTLDNSLFWKMYNALRDTEGVLWECDGSVNPENQDLNQSIADLSGSIANVLDNLQPIIQAIKEHECDPHTQNGSAN